MPEQEKTAVEKRVFCAGFYTFCVAVCLLQMVHKGNFPEIFPSFLIFFAAFAFASFSGRISEKRYLHFIVLLIYSGLVLWVREPFLFALISGLSSGTFSADAFATLRNKSKWAYAVRDYFSGGVCGITLASLGIFPLNFAAAPALALYTLSVFCQKSENKRSGDAYAYVFLLLLPGICYIVNLYPLNPAVPETDGQEMTEQVPESLRDANILTMAHFPVDNVLLIQPEYSKHEKHKKESDGDSRQKIINYPDFVSVQDRLISDKNRYDLIIIMQIFPELNQYNREFVQLLKSHLTPHGVVVYLLPDDDAFRAGALRASMQQHFKYIRTSGKLRLMAASDLSLNNEETLYISNVLDSILYTKEWETQTAAEAAAVKVPTSSDYAFERKSLSRKTSNPLLKAFYDHLPLKPMIFLITLAGLFLFYVIIRYLTAYISGMGLRLTVFFHSVLFFFIVGYLFFARSLNGYPYGLWYSVALCPLLISGILGCYVPIKYYRWGLPILLVVGIISWFLMPHYGIIFIIGAWIRCLMIGFVLPSIFWHSVGKYETGTVEPSVLLESTSSGLFAAMLLLAMMP